MSSDKTLEAAIEKLEKQPATLEDLMKAGDSLDQDRAKAEIVKNLMEKDNLGMVSDVDNYEIAMLSALKSVNAGVDSDLIKATCDSIMELRVSHERKGRSEIVEITKNETPKYDNQRPWYKFWG